MVLLFGIGMEKKREVFKKEIKKLFLSKEAIEFQLKDYNDSLILLDGFGHGQMLNNNEKFKETFGYGVSSQMKVNINSLFPSLKQKNTHNELMSQK